MLAAPMLGRTEAMLSQAVAAAVQRGLVEPHQHVVCVESVREVLTLKVIAVDALGRGMSRQTFPTGRPCYRPGCVQTGPVAGAWRLAAVLFAYFDALVGWQQLLSGVCSRSPLCQGKAMQSPGRACSCHCASLVS